MGLVGPPPLTRSSAKWHSALQTNSRAGNGIKGSFVAATGGREWGPSPIFRGTRTWKPGLPERLLFVSSPYSSDSFFIQSRETRGGDTPPAFSHMAIGTGGGRGRRPPENRREPVQGTRLRDAHSHKVPSGTLIDNN